MMNVLPRSVVTILAWRQVSQRFFNTGFLGTRIKQIHRILKFSISTGNLDWPELDRFCESCNPVKKNIRSIRAIRVPLLQFKYA